MFVRVDLIWKYALTTDLREITSGIHGRILLPLLLEKYCHQQAHLGHRLSPDLKLGIVD